jgi:glycosyltransferase involved in cell wall biosynthesis
MFRKLMSKPTLLISNDHQDKTGGGTHVMMMLNILKKHYKIFVQGAVDYYCYSDTPWKLEAGEIHAYDGSFIPDVHLYASFRGWTQPLGKKNVQIIFYPIDKVLTGWDQVIGLNNFVIEASRLNWSVKADIVEPYFNFDKFYISEKEDSVINIGNYFFEDDGHSKNQHLVIGWFKKQKKLKKLICHGMISSQLYYDELLRLSEDDNRIIIKNNCMQDEIKNDLSKAKYMLHAIGYGRTNPAQTEHFGLVAVEALLSGVQPVVHHSGGCKDIPGVLTYDRFDEIQLPETTDTDSLRAYGHQFSIQNSENQLMKALYE